MVSTTCTHAHFPCEIRTSVINNDRFSPNKKSPFQVNLFVIQVNFSCEQSEADLV